MKLQEHLLQHTYLW